MIACLALMVYSQTQEMPVVLHVLLDKRQALSNVLIVYLVK
jgi:hypothetical protein